MVGCDPILVFFCAAEFLQTVRALERYEWLERWLLSFKRSGCLLRVDLCWIEIVNLHPGKLTWQWKDKRLKMYLLSQPGDYFIDFIAMFVASVGFCHLLKVQGVINQIYHGFFGGAMFVQLRRWDVTSCLVCWIPWFKDHDKIIPAYS